MTAAQEKPVGSRPYSRMKGAEPSVTTILGMLDKPGLSWGAAKETALFAVHHQADWAGLDTQAAVDKLRRHHRGVWDSKAAVGSVVHAVNESWITGEVYDVPEDMQAKVEPYIEGLHKFWKDWNPSDFRTEDVVRRPGTYIGTRDLVGNLGFDKCLLDLKSTAELDPEKGIYTRDWALQLAAYRYATEVVHYKRDDKGKLFVDSVEDNEDVDWCGIVHLRGDGDYTLFQVNADLEVWDTFMSMAQLFQALKETPTSRIITPDMIL